MVQLERNKEIKRKERKGKEAISALVTFSSVLKNFQERGKPENPEKALGARTRPENNSTHL